MHLPNGSTLNYVCLLPLPEARVSLLRRFYVLVRLFSVLM